MSRELRPLTWLAVAHCSRPLWILPEWIGSGNPLDGGEQAAQPAVLEPVACRAPVAAGTRRACTTTRAVVVELFALVAIASALRRYRARARIPRPGLLVIAARRRRADAPRTPAMTQMCLLGEPALRPTRRSLCCACSPGVGVALRSPRRRQASVPRLRSAPLALLVAPPVDRARAIVCG